MADKKPLAPLHAALSDLLRWLKAEKLPGVVIGGVAASILGRPRMTRDVDVLVILDAARWEAFLNAGRRHGFAPRRSDALDFARKARVLLVRHEPSGTSVDISFGALPFEEEAVSRAVKRSVGGLRIPIPTPEDLIVMKAVAHRPRDAADIEAVIAAQPRLDRRRIRRITALFAEALESPEILDDVERLLAKGRRRRKPKGK